MAYSEEYERKMSNGLQSGFLQLYCIMGIIFSAVGAIWLTIDALWNHRLLELLAIPAAAVIIYLCSLGGGKAEEWGLRNLDEAKTLREAERQEYARQQSRGVRGSEV